MFGFGKKDKKVEFKIPVSGKIIELDQVADPVFSSKMMGDGFAIEPMGNEIYAPITGEVISVFPHAVGIKNEQGLEVLVHVGLDSVKLQGEGFTSHVNQGDKINAGDLMIEVDFATIKDKIPAITTPVIFTNLSDYSFSVEKTDVVACQDDAVSVK